MAATGWRRSCPARRGSHLPGPHTDARLYHAGNVDAALELTLLVSGLLLHMDTLHEKVLHFIVEAAHPYGHSWLRE